MDNVLSDSNADSAPVEGMTSTSLPANDAALSSALQVHDLAQTRHSLRPIDEATKAHIQPVEAICAAFTEGIASSDPSQSFLELTTEYLPDLHRIHHALMDTINSRDGDIQAAADEAQRMADKVAELYARSEVHWEEYDVMIDLVCDFKLRVLSKERLDGSDELDEFERLKEEAQALKAKASETADAVREAASASRRASKRAMNYAGEMRTSVSVMRTVGAFIAELEAMSAHMRPRMPLDDFNL